MVHGNGLSEVVRDSTRLLRGVELTQVGVSGLGRDTLKQAAEVVPAIAPRVLTLWRPR